MPTRPASSKGVRQDRGDGSESYVRTTRAQSNGGRSLKAEHLAWYREQLRKERAEG